MQCPKDSEEESTASNEAPGNVAVCCGAGLEAVEEICLGAGEKSDFLEDGVWVEEAGVAKLFVAEGCGDEDLLAFGENPLLEFKVFEGAACGLDGAVEVEVRDGDGWGDFGEMFDGAFPKGAIGFEAGEGQGEEGGEGENGDVVGAEA